MNLALNTTALEHSYATFWNNTAPTILYLLLVNGASNGSG
jgi:hypothetical protein